MALDNYLASITTPDVNDVQFSTQLDQMVEVINDNFRKIISAPFLKGDKGNNILHKKESIYEPGSNIFTLFGAELVNVIYGANTILVGQGYDDLVAVLDDDLGTGILSCAQLDPNDPNNELTVDVFYDIYDRSKTMATLYMFLDRRINKLENVNDANKSLFIDHSCAVYGKFENEVWNLEKNSIFPTLYYNNIPDTSSMGEFCWKINGQETGVTAQGIAGLTGKDAKIIIAKGVEDWATAWTNDNIATRVVINEIISPIDDQDPNSIIPSDNIIGNLALIWFDVDWFDYCDPTNIDTISDPLTREDEYTFIPNTTTGSFEENCYYQWSVADSDWVKIGNIKVNQIVKQYSDPDNYIWSYYTNTGNFQQMQSLNMIAPFINPNAAFGIVKYANDKYYIDYQREQDLGRIVSNLSMRKLLNNTGYTGYTSEEAVRGLYLRGNTITTGNGNDLGISENVHMIYAKDAANGKDALTIREVHNLYTKQNMMPPETYVAGGVLNLDYGNINMHGLHDTSAADTNISYNEGLTIRKTANYSGAERSFMNLVGMSHLGEVGRLQIKQLEEPKDMAGVLSLIPFTDINVSYESNDKYVSFDKPQFTYISATDTTSKRKDIGMRPTDSSFNYGEYHLFDGTIMSSNDDIRLELPSNSIFTSINSMNYIDRTLRIKYIDHTDTVNPNKERIGNIYLNVAIQNIGLQTNSTSNDDIFIVDYTIKLPYSEITTPTNPYPALSDIKAYPLFRLISHQDIPSIDTDPGDSVKAKCWSNVCSMRFFLILNRTDGNVVIEPYDLNRSAYLPDNTLNPAGGTYGPESGMIKSILSNKYAYLKNPLMSPGYLQMSINNFAIDQFKNWEWCQVNYNPTTEPASFPENKSLRCLFYKYAYSNDQITDQVYRPTKSYISNNNIVDDDNYTTFIYDTFSNVLRPNSLLLSDYEANYTKHKIYQVFGLLHVDTNGNTLLQISNYPTETNRVCIPYINKASGDTNINTARMKIDEPEWLYINNQPMDIGTNKIANTYVPITFTGDDITGYNHETYYNAGISVETLPPL